MMEQITEQNRIEKVDCKWEWKMGADYVNIKRSVFRKTFTEQIAYWLQRMETNEQKKHTQKTNADRFANLNGLPIDFG